MTSCEINKYLLGNVIVLSVSFVDQSGDAIEPTSVSLEVKDPSGAIEILSPIADGDGRYHYDYEPLLSGMYYYNFQSTGDAVAMSQGQFYVIEQSI